MARGLVYDLLMPPLLRALFLTLVLFLEGIGSAILLAPAAMAAEDHAPAAAMPCHDDGSGADHGMPCCDDDDGARCHINCFGGISGFAPRMSTVATRPEAIPPRVAVPSVRLPAHLDSPFRPPAFSQA